MKDIQHDVKEMICPNCGYEGSSVKKKQINPVFVTILIFSLFLFFFITTLNKPYVSLIFLLIIVIILLLIFSKRGIFKYVNTYKCPKCGDYSMVSLDSNLGKTIKANVDMPVKRIHMPIARTNIENPNAHSETVSNIYVKTVEKGTDQPEQNMERETLNKTINNLRESFERNPEKIKGDELEMYIAAYLHKKYLEDMTNNLNHLVVNDLLIWNGKAAAQIDHIVIFPWGLLVIEDKNFSGWIYGKEEEKYWTRVFFKDKETFYNPIKQNEKHVKALRQMLADCNVRYQHVHYESLIVFSNECKLKTKCKTRVVQRLDLQEALEYYEALHPQTLLSNLDRSNIFSFLQHKNEKNAEKRFMHVKYIRDKYKGGKKEKRKKKERINFRL